MYCFPKLGLATSSIINVIKGSKKDCNPFGAELTPLFEYADLIEKKTNIINKIETIIAKTFFVIDKSNKLLAECVFTSTNLP